MTLYRKETATFGFGVEDAYKPGTVIHKLGFQSTSTDPNVWDGNVHLKIEEPVGTPAIDVYKHQLSFHSC